MKREIDEELGFHIEQRRAENVAAGMSPEEAAREARKQFGNMQSVREECREAKGAGFGEEMLSDIRFGLRLLRKNPSFTAMAVLTLALGIGATTSIFCWVNAMVFRPLPFPDADRLVLLSEEWTAKGWGRSEVSAGTFADWQEQSRSFDALAAFEGMSLRTKADNGVETLRGLRISTMFFQVLKLHPVLGREFLPAEGQSGKDQVAILSHELWERRFSGRRDVIGASLDIDGVPHTIVGVMPEGFRFPYDTDVWLPLTLSPEVISHREKRSFEVMGRLKADSSLSKAQTELSGITARIAGRYPSSNQGWGCAVESLRVLFVSGNLRAKFSVLLAAAALVLLAACANVANLLLIRFERRQQEIAVRSSLGAGRARIVRLMLTESLVLSALGTIAGLLLAIWLSSALGVLIPGYSLRGIKPVFDQRVLFFTLGLCVVAGLTFGTLPAWWVARSNSGNNLKQPNGISGIAGGSRRWANLWIISEVACAVTLLMGAGLMILTLARLTRTDLGFDPSRLLVAEINPTWDAGEPDYSPKKVLYYGQLREELARAGGISDAAIFRDAGWLDCLPEGQAQAMKLYGASCSTNLFRTLGVPLIRGRLYPEEWRRGDPIEVVVNETFARRGWPGQSALGKRFRPDSPGAMWVVVVGVVRDFRLERDQAVRPRYYSSYRSAYLEGVQFILRSNGSESGVAIAARQILRRFDPYQGNPSVRSMNDLLGDVLRPRYQMLSLLGGFAGVAFILAAIGIYGVVGYSVAQQRRAIGIRIALGALPADVMALVIRQGMTPVLVGIGCGALGSVALGHFLAGQFSGMASLHAGILAGISVLMFITAFLACFVPACGAANTDPMESLRCE